MIRVFPSVCGSLILAIVLACAGVPAPSLAQTTAPAKPKPGATQKAQAAPSKTAPSKSAASKGTSAKSTPPAKMPADQADSAAGKPLLVASYGDWGAFAAQSGTTKTCYALTQPKDRVPSDLKRDPAYIFIADRPAENVHDEVSIIMGFDVKGGGEEKVAASTGAGAAPEASAEIGAAKFMLVAKGSNLWLKNVAEEAPMIAAMRKNAKLTVQATSLKGHVTTDDYSLSGLAQALDRMHKECQ
jgi:hypothetical protein